VVSFAPDSLLTVNGKPVNIEGNASPVTDESGVVTGVVVTFRDVTERKRNDRLLASQADELLRSNRELEQFAYVASHDLQEPLRMVNTFTELFLRKLGDHRTAELDQIAGVIREGILRMNDLIKDLLSFSRVGHDSVSLSSIDPRLALADAIAVCGPLILETSAEINSGEMPMVLAQRSQLTQVFQNLVTNAIKYRRDDVCPRIAITTQLRDRDVLFAIEDNGIGFEQAYAESIFGLFKRLHPTRYPGTGLGLAISQKIVERSHGRIWAESSPGNGSKFSFTLPAG
jgi:two-component system, chemotaxis family, sensor kinase Cph1